MGERKQPLWITAGWIAIATVLVAVGVWAIFVHNVGLMLFNGVLLVVWSAFYFLGERGAG